MLKSLSVENYALIDSLLLLPDSEISIITGQTGAGKSIMLDALSLLLGERADAKVIADKTKKSVIEAVFSDIDDNIAEKVRLLDPEWDGSEIIVRREILPTGRSRSFLNDSPVRLSELAEITSGLVDIHSQHSNTGLTDPSEQLRILDTMACNGEIISRYKELFAGYVSLRNRIKLLKEKNEKIRANRKIYEFQLEQLNQLKPKRGELEAVEKRFDILSDAEEIRAHLSEASYLLGTSESSALSEVSEAITALQRVDLSLFEPMPEEKRASPRDDADSPLVIRLQQVYIELKDIAETIEQYRRDAEFDPSELARVTARMNELYDAEKHFHVSNGDELVDLHQKLQAEMLSLMEENDNVADLEKQMQEAGKQLKAQASLLTESRIAAARIFERRLEESARTLGLPNIRFKVEIISGKLTREGADSVRFLCSFNKNSALDAIEKIASGGELSRLMLSIKGIVAGQMKLPTVIFDEIDTGVSGEIADRMGEMMKDMSKRMQVITITHLPQVASKGNTHFKVYKRDLPDRTVSGIRQLTMEQRVEEIASMLSGSVIDKAALDNARSLLDYTTLKR